MSIPRYFSRAATLLVVALGGELAAPSVLADESTRRLQQSLRERHFYDGEVDGERGPQTADALRRFQHSRGLPATGELDSQTLFSLDMGSEGAAREMAENDRRFLESLDAATEHQGLGDAAAAQRNADALRNEAQEKTANEAASQERASREAAAERQLNEETRQSEAARQSEETRQSEAARQSEVARQSEAARRSGDEERERQVENFVRAYLAASAGNGVSEEMAFYADRVNYFGHGLVGRDFIERDVRSYYRRWPHRVYALRGVRVVSSTPGEVVVRFRMGFQLRSATQIRGGEHDYLFTLRQTESGWRFSSLQEEPAAR